LSGPGPAGLKKKNKTPAGGEGDWKDGERARLVSSVPTPRGRKGTITRNAETAPPVREKRPISSPCGKGNIASTTFQPTQKREEIVFTAKKRGREKVWGGENRGGTAWDSRCSGFADGESWQKGRQKKRGRDPLKKKRGETPCWCFRQKDHTGNYCRDSQSISEREEEILSERGERNKKANDDSH